MKSILFATALVFPVLAAAMQESFKTDESKSLVARMRTPNHIPVPKSVPAYETITRSGVTRLCFARAAYYRTYFEAWNEQLYQYGKLCRDLEPEASLVSITSFNGEPYSGMGMAKGGIDCHKLLMTLKKQYGDKRVRKAARQAYQKTKRPCVRFSRSTDPPEFDTRPLDLTFEMITDPKKLRSTPQLVGELKSE